MSLNMKTIGDVNIKLSHEDDDSSSGDDSSDNDNLDDKDNESDDSSKSENKKSPISINKYSENNKNIEPDIPLLELPLNSRNNESSSDSDKDNESDDSSKSENKKSPISINKYSENNKNIEPDIPLLELPLNSGNDNESSDNDNSDDELSDNIPSNHCDYDDELSNNIPSNHCDYDDELSNFEIPDELLKEQPKKLIISDEKIQELMKIPFILRKTFPFCFWYISYIEDNELDEIKKITLNVIELLLKINNDNDIYIIRCKKEMDRVRIICPNIYVNSQISKDIRSLILRDLGYKVSSNIIPVLQYEAPISPTILQPRVWDMGLNKYESHKEYTCLLHKNLKTEEIEKLMLKFSIYDSSKELTKFSEEYIEYLETKDINSNKNNLLDEEELISFSIENNIISKEIKQEFGKNLDKCIKWFNIYHPDSILRNIKKLGENEIFLLDFTKSKHKCNLCNLVHNSNRQYLTYSKKSKKAFYHCYDTEAVNKKNEISFKDPKIGSETIYVN